MTMLRMRLTGQLAQFADKPRTAETLAEIEAFLRERVESIRDYRSAWEVTSEGYSGAVLLVYRGPVEPGRN